MNSLTYVISDLKCFIAFVAISVVSPCFDVLDARSTRAVVLVAAFSLYSISFSRRVDLAIEALQRMQKRGVLATPAMMLEMCANVQSHSPVSDSRFVCCECCSVT